MYVWLYYVRRTICRAAGRAFVVCSVLTPPCVRQVNGLFLAIDFCVFLCRVTCRLWCSSYRLLCPRHLSQVQCTNGHHQLQRTFRWPLLCAFTWHLTTWSVIIYYTVYTLHRTAPAVSAVIVCRRVVVSLVITSICPLAALPQSRHRTINSRIPQAINSVITDCIIISAITVVLLLLLLLLQSLVQLSVWT